MFIKLEIYLANHLCLIDFPFNRTWMDTLDCVNLCQLPMFKVIKIFLGCATVTYHLSAASHRLISYYVVLLLPERMVKYPIEKAPLARHPFPIELHIPGALYPQN